MLRRPYLVEATKDGEWFGWWIVGWRRARRLRTAVDAQLRSGASIDQVDARIVSPGAHAA